MKSNRSAVEKVSHPPQKVRQTNISDLNMTTQVASKDPETQCCSGHDCHAVESLLTKAKAVSAENELADLKKYIDILQEQMGNQRKSIGEITTQVEFYKAGLVNLQNGLEQLKATATITIVGGNAHGHKY